MFSKWRKKSAEKEAVQIYAPLTGEAVALSTVPDEAFAQGHMGPGIAIEPVEGRLIAPFDGVIAHIIKSNHAVMMEHPSGLQFLFHIGVDTVSLKGEGFTSHVAAGDRVKAGQVLIEFDMDHIRAAGYPVITPIILTNAGEIAAELNWNEGTVVAGSSVILQAALKN